jgi:hypothetical protein
MTDHTAPYDPTLDRANVQRYRALLIAQTDLDIRDMLERLIEEAEARLAAAGRRD